MTMSDQSSTTLLRDFNSLPIRLQPRSVGLYELDAKDSELLSIPFVCLFILEEARLSRNDCRQLLRRNFYSDMLFHGNPFQIVVEELQSYSIGVSHPSNEAAAAQPRCGDTSQPHHASTLQSGSLKGSS